MSDSHQTLFLPFVFLALLTPAWPVVAQEASSSVDSPTQWVSDLADPDPRVRRLAEFKILAAEKEEAISALELGVQSFDLDLSSRCSLLLERQRLREKNRIAKLFLVEGEPLDPSLELPAWPEFSDFVGGDTLPGRRMFLRMCHQLPGVFEKYGIRGEQDAKTLAETALKVLDEGRVQPNRVVSSGIAFLFFSEVANKKAQENSESLFDDAQMKEFVDFFTGGSFVDRARRNSPPPFQRLVSDWMLRQKEAGFLDDSRLFQFVHESGNKVLLQHVKERYDSLDAALRMKFVDLVTQVAVSDQKDWRSVHDWLKDAMLDETVALRTRRKKNPATELVVTVGMLAKGKLALAIKQSLATGEPIKGEGVFGRYEFSGGPFVVVADEQEQLRLKEYLESNLNRD